MKDENLRLVTCFEKKTGRYWHDKRKVVDYYLCEYVDKDNIPYRKAFSCKKGAIPNIPESGLNSVITSLRYQ